MKTLQNCLLFSSPSKACQLFQFFLVFLRSNQFIIFPTIASVGKFFRVLILCQQQQSNLENVGNNYQIQFLLISKFLNFQMQILLQQLQTWKEAKRLFIGTVCQIQQFVAMLLLVCIVLLVVGYFLVVNKKLLQQNCQSYQCNISRFSFIQNFIMIFQSTELVQCCMLTYILFLFSAYVLLGQFHFILL
eukprot:TRINITY_DN8951_c0_g1_i3.p1 TRINITY_DN8951_c0_g1~~TRINITY_DN8951_c0_g1_i3.p1  ORF type:complete len:189 (+),score=-15.25 TRINITY_DN8951_c0_g1_i3:1171-1737(+)